MLRSIAITLSFLILSVTMPCLCSMTAGSVFVATDSTCDHQGEFSMGHSGDTGSFSRRMNPLDHVAMWRSFFSVSLGVFFVFLFLVAARGISRGRFLPFGFFVQRLQRRAILHPPPRATVSIVPHSLLEAFFSGTIRGKIFVA